MKEDKDIFGCRVAKDEDEKRRLNMIDQSNKLLLHKINFKNREKDFMKLMDKLDDRYAEIYNLRNEMDAEKTLDMVNQLSNLRQKAEKSIKLCRSLQKDIDIKISEMMKSEGGI